MYSGMGLAQAKTYAKAEEIWTNTNEALVPKDKGCTEGKVMTPQTVSRFLLFPKR